MEGELNVVNTQLASSDLALLSESAPNWFLDCFDVPREEGFVEVEGVQIHYLRWGNPTLPGVVLTHGFMAHARCWAFIAPLLAENYCLVAFDLSGMGDSGWRESYDVDVRSIECLAVAEAAGITQGDIKPALVCHSYGAGVGLSAVEMFPDAWRSFVVCDMSMLAPGEPSQFEERRKHMENRSIRPHRVNANFSEVRERFRLAPEQPCENAYLMEYMARHSIRELDEGYVWKFDPKIMGPDNDRDSNWWESIAPRFAGLQIPRAVIYGEHSTMMSARVREYVNHVSEDPIAQVCIRDAYHHLMMDQPIAFSSTIDSLLQSL
ncbi:MAG: pimeloyl-ACP methyl ester carboxylesterase [Limisphaerales bacterium]